MHAWHDIYVDDHLVENAFPVVIEVPMGSKNKYELDKDQLPQHLLREIRRFFEDYKALEHKQVVVEDMLGPADALRVLRDSLTVYRQLRRGELRRA